MKKIYVQAFAVAILPPIWAALASVFGVTTGAVLLITAGLVMLSKDSGAILSISLWIGDIWGAISFGLMSLAPAPLKIVAQVLVLAIFGFFAVLLSSHFSKVNLVEWLMGWALTMQILGMTPKDQLPITVVMIAISMVIRIYYVGYGIKYVVKRFS